MERFALLILSEFRKLSAGGAFINFSSLLTLVHFKLLLLYPSQSQLSLTWPRGTGFI